LRIEHHQGAWCFALFLDAIQNDQTVQNANLGRGKADARGVIHSLKHVIGQHAQCVRQIVDGGCGLFQTRVGVQ
tara:strand:+ start:233 stop:454 length:222 start_codon:yes stop_codon:yes gene_type:complete